MRLNLFFSKAFAVAAAVAMASATMCTPSLAHAPDMAAIDTNHDGSISLDEAHAAAGKKFDKADTKHIGKLNTKQAAMMSRIVGQMARHDKDHTIDKDEYMAGVDAAFKEADPTGSGTLDAAALKTKAGKHFLEMVE